MHFLKKNSITIICFFFNENKNILHFLKKANGLLNKCKKNGIKLEFILIDDGSTDGSFEKFKKNIKFKKFKIFKNEKNKSVAYSFKRGIKLAKNNIIFTKQLIGHMIYQILKNGFFIEKI